MKIEPIELPVKYYKSRFKWVWLNTISDLIFGRKYVAFDQSDLAAHYLQVQRDIDDVSGVNCYNSPGGDNPWCQHDDPSWCTDKCRKRAEETGKFDCVVCGIPTHYTVALHRDCKDGLLNKVQQPAAQHNGDITEKVVAATDHIADVRKKVESVKPCLFCGSKAKKNKRFA